MKYVTIIPGHEPKSKGAYNSRLDVYEYDVVNRICIELMKLEDDDNVDMIMKKRNVYSNLSKETKRLSSDLAIEIHLNAYNGEAQGTETLYYHTKTKSKQYAKYFNNIMVKHLGLRDKDILSRKNGDNGAPFLSLDGLACIIVEPFFLDSVKTKEELELLIKKTILALHEAIINFTVL